MRYLLAILLYMILPAAAVAADVPIKDFFKEAEFESVQLSPDGKHIAVTMPRSDRSLLVVLKVDDKSVVGSWDYGENYYFRQVTWVNNERLLYATSFKTGRFDFQVGLRDMYASDIDGTHRIVIPHGNFYSIVDTLPAERESVLVTRSIENAFLFKLNAYNGKITQVASSPIDFGTFVVDHDAKVRYSFGDMSDGSSALFRRDGDRWSLVEKSAPFAGNSLRPVGFSPDGEQALVMKNDGGAESLWRIDPVTGAGKEISRNGTVDASDLLWSSDRRTLLAVRYDDGVPYWDFIAPEHPETALFAGLVKAFPGKMVDFSGVSDDGGRVLLYVYSDRDPGQVYLFDTKAKQARFLLSSREWIKPAEMSPMKPVQVKTRDGMVIHGYLTVPAGSDGRNLPLVINPHGGPHGPRDEWGFNPEVQLLANRGYAVLQMNYRGSGGYGADYMSAGFRQWGTTMQDDLTDSVRWAIAQGITSPDRVCIYGASYGGYSALMSVVREPDLYRCTVGYVGVYDLDVQRASSDTAQSDYGRAYLDTVLPASAGERHAQSPIYGVDRIKSAVMLVHGAKDERVPIKNMYELVDRMEAAGKAPEEIVVEKKEAHGFRDLDNNVNLYTKMLAFFDKHIGGMQATAQTP
ncbi:S9 family peptidase [Luteimonas notoginsengisoli]|uniref:Prolyl oligopeptidase family serine peptidase n=1 Tax=Luteimonas notoginsengisoli TaxID=1578200 RepID=A0ABV7UV64_9GAMM